MPARCWVDGREYDISSPVVARDLGLGMVYQHFTVVARHERGREPAAGRGHLPMVVDWKAARAELEAFMATTPFQLPLDAHPATSRPARSKARNPQAAVLEAAPPLILDEPTRCWDPAGGRRGAGRAA